jgi:hypothetical protein
MESLCLSVRAFQHVMAEAHAKKAIDPEILDDDVVSLLSDIAVDEVVTHHFLQPDTDSNGAPEIQDSDNLVYATLDLLQHYIRALDSPRVIYKAIHQAVAVAGNTPHAYLRSKAFELLAVISMKHGFGSACVQEVNALLASGIWSGRERDHVTRQWLARRKCAADMALFLVELKEKEISMDHTSVRTISLSSCLVLTIVHLRLLTDTSVRRKNRRSSNLPRGYHPLH